VVVTANRTTTPGLEIASSYSVITAEELRSSNRPFLLEYLRDIEGIAITQQGGTGKLSAVFTRGANSNHTLIMVDGIKVNDPSSPNNTYDLASLQTDNVERVELVRGPQSTLYGSEAIAGVINITTRNGTDSGNFFVNAEGGSNKYYKGSAGISGSIDKLYYSAGAARIQTDGISAANEKYGNTELDGYENTAANAKLGYKFSDTFDLDFLYRYTKANTDLDQSSQYGDDPNYTYDLDEHIFKGTLNISLFEDKWQQKLWTAAVDRKTTAEDLPDELRPNDSSLNEANGNRTTIGWQNTLTFFENHLITAGIETEEETASSYFHSESEWGPFESEFPEQSVRTTGIYVQDQLNINNDFFASIGVRYDDHEKYGGKFTYRIAPAYYFSGTATKIKASVGTGFKSPTLFYLYDPVFGNPDLKPETSLGWDAGIEQFLLKNQLSIGVTYFNTKFEDMFNFDENFRTINIDKAETRGLEFYSTLTNFHKFTVKLNYTYTIAEDHSDDMTEENKTLIRRPKQQGLLNIQYTPSAKMDFAVSARFVGEREDNDFSTWPSSRVVLDNYTLIDIFASYDLLDYLTIYGRIENLFDEDYEEVLYYGTIGRAGYLGLSLNL
jgi:vitamin B12 transporter